MEYYVEIQSTIKKLAAKIKTSSPEEAQQLQEQIAITTRIYNELQQAIEIAQTKSKAGDKSLTRSMDHWIAFKRGVLFSFHKSGVDSYWLVVNQNTKEVKFRLPNLKSVKKFARN